MDDCTHKTLKKQLVGNQHWYACGSPIWVDELKALANELRHVMRECAHNRNPDRCTRCYLEQIIAEIPEGCGEKFLCEPWDGEVKVDEEGEH